MSALIIYSGAVGLGQKQHQAAARRSGPKVSNELILSTYHDVYVTVFTLRLPLQNQPIAHVAAALVAAKIVENRCGIYGTPMAATRAAATTITQTSNT
ncbi:hypothetical protein [Paralcaligenes ureilyticus]|uniref:hypothetical protein n=1 Tax=Paralcaligenes ureilyticus TaxID=627131 RepID=UPI0010467A9A|nr:hypothetical protein [Paralcaligenes ureilyticus]